MNDHQLLGATPILEMRNCIQQCAQLNNKRSGVGMLIGDNADILLGEWQEGKLHGWYVYLSENSQAYGFMKEGHLEGFNVVQVDENLTVCGFFVRNLAHEICLVTTADKYQITRFINGIKQEILEKGSYSKHTVYEIIKRSYPGQVIGLRKFLSYQLRQAADNQVAEIEINTMYRYYGFVSASGTEGEGVGMVFKNDILFNYGTYSRSELSGLGRLYIKDEIHDGVFEGGVLVGPGVKYDYNSNQYTFGMHSQPNSDFERGYSFPTEKIKGLRKELHLRSMDYLNQVLVMDRLVRIRLGDIMPDMKEQRQPEEQYIVRNTRPNRVLEKSSSGRTVQSKPSSYTNDNSPLKRMLRQYDKVSERVTPQKRRRRIEYDLDRSSTPPNKSPSVRRGREDEEDYKPALNRQIYQQRSNQPPQQYQSPYQPKPQRSNYPYREEPEDSMVAKDTFSMIKHMEQIERQKRQDLDRVYQTKASRGNRR